MQRFRVHLDASGGAGLLPESLREQYGSELAFPDPPPGRPYIFSNIVTTLDGITAFGGSHGRSEGRLISMHSSDDQWLLGILRGVADCVIVGAGTLRSEPGHTWTPGALSSAPSDELLRWRLDCGRPANPLQCFVTGSGNIDLKQPVFLRDDLDVVIITTSSGAARMGQPPRTGVRVAEAGDSDLIDLPLALKILREQFDVRLLLCEGGPHLFGQLLAADVVDECFQTIAPQMAGAEGPQGRISLTGGAAWEPGSTPLFRLLSLRTGNSDQSHLFLRLKRVRT